MKIQGKLHDDVLHGVTLRLCENGTICPFGIFSVLHNLCDETNGGLVAFSRVL